MEGWISLQRKMQKHWLWEENREFSKAEAWIDLLLSVNHSPAKVMIKGVLINVDRGQTVMSLETLSKRWKWSRSKVSRFLKLLKSDSMIEYESKQVTTHITVCNYESYQGERNTNETQTRRKRTSDETQANTNNNDNNDNNDNNLKNKAKPRSVEQVFEYMTEINYPDAKFNSGQFFNHYEANGWMRGRTGKQPIKDWRAVVRTWMGRVKKDDKLVKDEYGSVVGQKTDYAALAKYYGITEEEARKHYKPIN